MYYLKTSKKYNDPCLPPVLPQQGNQNRWFAKTFNNHNSFFTVHLARCHITNIRRVWCHAPELMAAMVVAIDHKT
jgi:hypothetical protein